MTCVGDAVMLCSTMLYDVWICYCMLLCIYVISAGLFRLFGRVGIFWPGVRFEDGAAKCVLPRPFGLK